MTLRALRAKVIKEFYGVIDGQIYPRMVLVGEIIHGDLAATAHREKWATTEFEEGAPPAADIVEKLPETPEKANAAPVDEQQARIFDNMAAAGLGGVSAKLAAMKIRADEATAPIDIPDDWRALKWFALKSLAEKVKNAPVANADEARIAIEAELGARAAK